jgi:hypothetical protein
MGNIATSCLGLGVGVFFTGIGLVLASKICVAGGVVIIGVSTVFGLYKLYKYNPEKKELM